MPRRIARAPDAPVAALLLDLLPLLLGAALLAVATGRPIFTGVVIAALGAGFALADHTMRETLREPVVFSEIGRAAAGLHPSASVSAVRRAGRWCWAGPRRRCAAGAGAAAFRAAGCGNRGRLLALAVRGADRCRDLADRSRAGARRRCRRAAPARRRAASRLRCRGARPVRDAARSTVIARAERGGGGGARHRAALPVARRCRGTRAGARRPDSSWCNASRFSTRAGCRRSIPRELLAGFDACCASAAPFGRLEVPGWGANTMRAEFAVLTGIPESELGYDRFNPYYALARVPIASQVWRLRRAGYRTICLHPFDRRFFRRDLAMPALGFERFLGRETPRRAAAAALLSGPRAGRATSCGCSSRGTARHSFSRSRWAITVLGCETGPPIDPDDRRAVRSRRRCREGGGLLRYLDGLRRSDEMLQILMGGLSGAHAGACWRFTATTCRACRAPLPISDLPRPRPIM